MIEFFVLLLLIAAALAMLAHTPKIRKATRLPPAHCYKA